MVKMMVTHLSLTQRVKIRPNIAAMMVTQAPIAIPNVQRNWVRISCRSSRLLAFISWRSCVNSLVILVSKLSILFSKWFILVLTSSRIPSTLASLSSAMSSLLYPIQIFLAQTKVSQDSCQSSFRNIFASVVRNGGISISLGTPPDLVPTFCLAPELAPQLPQFSGKLPIGHGVPTVRRSSP